MPLTYKSLAVAAVHEMMEGLHGARAIDKRTLREFDDGCLTPVMPIGPEEIKAIRNAERVSRLTLARHLSVSKHLVSEWERGTKRPGEPVLKLLTIIQRKGLSAIF